jgi:predicted transglutaminase-like protease
MKNAIDRFDSWFYPWSDKQAHRCWAFIKQLYRRFHTEFNELIVFLQNRLDEHRRKNEELLKEKRERIAKEKIAEGKRQQSIKEEEKRSYDRWIQHLKELQETERKKNEERDRYIKEHPLEYERLIEQQKTTFWVRMLGVFLVVIPFVCYIIYLFITITKNVMIH